MMKKRVYLYAVVAIAVAVAAVITVSYTLFGQGSPQLGQGGQAQEIVPASYGGSSCPTALIGVYTFVKYLGTAGGIKTYNISNQPTGFLVQPGHTGVISFLVYRQGLNLHNNTRNAPTANISNNIYLMHISREIVNQSITQINALLIKYQNNTVTYNGSIPHRNGNITVYNGSTITFPNGTELTLTKNTSFTVKSLPIGETKIALYRGCTAVHLQGPGGGEEIGCHDVSKYAPHSVSIVFTNYTHTGINITLQPKYELLKQNQSTIVNATFSVAANATKGTYLLNAYMSGETCDGLFALFTIGNTPYNGTDTNSTNPPPLFT